ncbi:hypothetical protein EDB83DRAFT_2355859, partial [Lactarius deliciosus]
FVLDLNRTYPRYFTTIFELTLKLPHFILLRTPHPLEQLQLAVWLALGVFDVPRRSPRQKRPCEETSTPSCNTSTTMSLLHVFPSASGIVVSSVARGTLRERASISTAVMLVMSRVARAICCARFGRPKCWIGNSCGVISNRRISFRSDSLTGSDSDTHCMKTQTPLRTNSCKCQQCTKGLNSWKSAATKTCSALSQCSRPRYAHCPPLLYPWQFNITKKTPLSFALLSGLILSAMARWRSDTDELKGLTEAESMLILPAARLCAALIYLAVNPGGDSLHYAGKTSSELQSVTDIFREYPSTQEAPHRIHPVLTIVGKRWRRAAREGRPPKLEDISLESVEKGCADLAKSHPNQPPVFYSADLSTLLDRIPKVQHWWKSKAKQGQGRSNLNKEKAKGKASIPADANSGVDPPPRGQLPRGTKRSAAAVAQPEEEPDEDDDREIEATPWKAGKTVAHRVRFQSPDAPPKQRRRLGDDPDVEESDDEPVELWVARGEDRCDACKQRNIRVCEPQWGAPRSSACKTCARKKQTCRSTRAWRNELANMFQCKPQGPLSDQAEVTEVPARPAGGAPAIQVDDIPQSGEGTSRSTYFMSFMSLRSPDPLSRYSSCGCRAKTCKGLQWLCNTPSIV